MKNPKADFFFSFYKKNKNKWLALNYMFFFLLVLYDSFVFILSIEYYPSFHPRLVNLLLIFSHFLGFVTYISLLGDAPRKRLTFVIPFGMLFCSILSMISSHAFPQKIVDCLSLGLSCIYMFSIFLVFYDFIIIELKCKSNNK